MYEIKIITSFAAAHCLRHFRGKCEALHGHNWKVEVFLQSPVLDKAGLVMDFKVAKETTKALLEELDHKYLNELEPFSQENPSSENIARFIFRELSKKLNQGPVVVHKVTAWESEDACASYFERA
jgi:6-pyruvoyltetrahydropterin/6-carboxytetrahydropterin synthase